MEHAGSYVENMDVQDPKLFLPSLVLRWLYYCLHWTDTKRMSKPAMNYLTVHDEEGALYRHLVGCDSGSCHFLLSAYRGLRLAQTVGCADDCWAARCSFDLFLVRRRYAQRRD